MTPGVVNERVRHVADVRRNDVATAVQVHTALVAARQIESWVQAQVAALTAHLATIESFPEASIAAASKSSLGQASKIRERSDTLASTPSFASALDDGAITAGHVDAVTRASKQLDEPQRDALFDRVESLVAVAAAGTVDQFSKRIKFEVQKLQTASADDRLARQRRNARLSTWVDDEGMWNMRGRFDPVTGLRLATGVDNAVQALFGEHTPEGCPTDPVEKQKFLAAHAVVRLLEDGGTTDVGRPSRPDFVGVIDADAPVQGDSPLVDWPIPIEVPGRILAELAADRDVAGVVVRNGVVLYAPGQLDLGRTTRLASRAQRRALRGLYRGCAIPGCSVAFDRCKLHHVVWWRHGGLTDLDNLLPVCAKHHANIHNDHWIVELGPRRQLTLRLSDGTIHNTGPPSRRAA